MYVMTSWGDVYREMWREMRESYGGEGKKGNVEKICRACRDPIDRHQERI